MTNIIYLTAQLCPLTTLHYSIPPHCPSSLLPPPTTWPPTHYIDIGDAATRLWVNRDANRFLYISLFLSLPFPCNQTLKSMTAALFFFSISVRTSGSGSSMTDCLQKKRRVCFAGRRVGVKKRRTTGQKKAPPGRQAGRQMDVQTDGDVVMLSDTTGEVCVTQCNRCQGKRRGREKKETKENRKRNKSVMSVEATVMTAAAVIKVSPKRPTRIEPWLHLS